MYHHVKKLMYTVRSTSDPRFGNMRSSSSVARTAKARCGDAVFDQGSLRGSERKTFSLDRHRGAEHTSRS